MIWCPKFTNVFLYFKVLHNISLVLFQLSWPFFQCIYFPHEQIFYLLQHQPTEQTKHIHTVTNQKYRNQNFHSIDNVAFLSTKIISTISFETTIYSKYLLFSHPISKSLWSHQSLQWYLLSATSFDFPPKIKNTSISITLTKYDTSKYAQT